MTSLLEKPPSAVYSFNIDRKVLSSWLLEQQKSKPSSTFHNVDVILHYFSTFFFNKNFKVLRYELSYNNLNEEFVPPLNITAYWRIEPTQTDLRIDYRLNTSTGLAAQNPLLNIIFSTIVGSNITSFNSDPEAKWFVF